MCDGAFFAVELSLERHLLAEAPDLAREGIELAARHDGEPARAHPPAEGRDEMTVARDNQERPHDRIVDRDRDPLGAFWERGCAENGSKKLWVAIETQREVDLAARKAIQS
jgi:hypothetical protein